jgi:site-specific recombinase XerD
MKLAKAIAQYVELKQSMGSRFHAEQVILKAFSKAMGDIGCEDVRPDHLYTYLSGSGPITRFFHRKHDALSGFYRFAIGRGYATCSPLPTVLPKPANTFTPYVYSNDELQRLADAAALQEHPRKKLQGLTLRTLILVLYGAGLRLSEALNLKLADVNLPDRLLTIRESKFYKTRLVPIGPRLTAVLSAYAKKRYQLACSLSPDSLFFVARDGGRLTLQMMEKSFARLRDITGVHRNDGARYQPRVHDLRGTFAVHRLVSWYRQGADVQRLLPQLSTYLGHVHVSSTQKYLTMTPELLQEASMRFERYAKGGPNHD